jgi:hypothetical protein
MMRSAEGRSASKEFDDRAGLKLHCEFEPGGRCLTLPPLLPESAAQSGYSWNRFIDGTTGRGEAQSEGLDPSPHFECRFTALVEPTVFGAAKIARPILP